MKYSVYLDSRQSSGARPSCCSFNLNQTICGAVSCTVSSFVFANNLHNVVSGLNTLVFGTTTITVTPGFWSFADLIDDINAQLLATPAFVTLMGGAPGAVALDSQDNAVWTIGTNVLSSGGLYQTFVLTTGTSYTGNFQTLIFLASPQAISLQSSTLQGPERFVTSYSTPITQPFLITHINSGFGEMDGGALQVPYTIQLGQTNFNQLQIMLFDPNTNRELTEISQWSILLEIMTMQR